MEKPKNIQMENYVFMEQDEIQLLYPLSFSEEEIKDYTDYLDTILDENSKVKILCSSGTKKDDMVLSSLSICFLVFIWVGISISGTSRYGFSVSGVFFIISLFIKCGISYIK